MRSPRAVSKYVTEEIPTADVTFMEMESPILGLKLKLKLGKNQFI